MYSRSFSPSALPAAAVGPPCCQQLLEAEPGGGVRDGGKSGDNGEESRLMLKAFSPSVPVLVRLDRLTHFF